RALGSARGILPDQGPIGVFIHHNTLHALQHLPFHEGVAEGARLTGARPYLSVDEFRTAWARGRITAPDLDEALGRFVGSQADEPAALGLRRLALWRMILLHDPEQPEPAGTAYRLGLAGEADRWAACLGAAARRGSHPPERPAIDRHHEAFLALEHPGTDATVHRELIRLTSGFLDRGQALGAMPGREEGFLAAVAALYAAAPTSPRGAPGTGDDFAGLHSAGRSARQVVEECLLALGVGPEDQEAFVRSTLLALPGWAGMFSRLEAHPEEGLPGIPYRLEDYLAVRLVIERRAVAAAARALGVTPDLQALRALVPAAAANTGDMLAARLHALTTAAGWSTERVAALQAPEVEALVRDLEAFPMLARRRVWQEAYEGWYRRHVLDALAARRALGPRARPARPEAQFVFCIDEREESIRRAIEEQGPALETFGAAGFFGVAIDFRGLYDAEPAAHCPVVVVPDHEVHEAPLYTAAGWDAARRRMRQGWHAVHRVAHRRSRTLLGGALLSFALGPAAAAMAMARVAFPRASLGAFHRWRNRLLPRPATRLAAVRASGESRSDRGKWLGFTLDEAADRVAGTLRNIGLTTQFAPIVVVLGHGSTSLNNPHESAHDCGACGGRRGGANARLFAEMANRPAIREAVAARGIVIPADTWFVGALHDTADDGVQYFDVDVLPRESYLSFGRADLVLQRARELSAQERCRRFEHAPLGISPADALDHVEDRASSLGQPRPEYGHCTNAAAIVGRRELSRGVHLDRRAFLISYDPSIDPEAAILERVLAAVGPVGAGISLEYYFSSVDNEVYGCGTKLPHNVTGLVGIMNGHHSDLRTGLPLQMVELHEPVRLLLIVEATPEALLKVAGRQAEVRELVVNEWVQLVSVDPVTGAMHHFRDGGFVPYTPGSTSTPTVQRSIEWHGQSREYVPPAITLAAIREEAVTHG
ncbi:MAG: DUF2309 domain-containing protein, partial [Gemmatimonadetes bacterium]|nr:DUF2309 domain-containing protein [Gemmatimonadota bacterium]